MMNYEEKLLKGLLEKYNRSKKDTKTNKIHLRTSLSPTKLYPLYEDNEGDTEEIQQINALCEELQQKGWITYSKHKNFSNTVKEIVLQEEQLTEIKHYLRKNYNYVSKDEHLLRLQQIVDQYAQASPICRQECQKLQEELNQRRVPARYEDYTDLLKAVAFLENNREDLYLRELSLKLYGDSKYLENTLLPNLCSLLNKYDTLKEKHLVEDEILQKYHIHKEPEKISLKGNFTLTMQGKSIDCQYFQDGIEFSAAELENIDSIQLQVPNFLTIENRTSYLRYHRKDTVCFYLGGYANRFQRDFLKKIYIDNPQCHYQHFGDMDAGGFLIHQNLCEITNIPFELFAMSCAELQNPAYQHCLHPLTPNDRKRLENLSNQPTYKDVVTYMLQHNIKLEQEIISYTLMKK